MLGEAGVRLPGARRRGLRAQAERDGLVVPPALLRQLEELAA